MAASEVEFVSARQVVINMPQMAVGGLSEGWLLRELGDVHWQAICRALDTPSHAIVDEAGNRLYATFVRLRWESTGHLKAFHENETLHIRGWLSRYGTSVFFSDCEAAGQTDAIRASLMTTFALRESDNKSLLRGVPAIAERGLVPAVPSLPQFAVEYRETRAGQRRSVELAGERLSLEDVPLFQMEYRLNPYHDFNGVNLLYFAAYPSIVDICEREFVHRHRDRVPGGSDWALETSTVARDVYYYGNCAIDDTVLFQLDAYQLRPGDRVLLAASLRRQSDGQLLANVFTVKAHDPSASST